MTTQQAIKQQVSTIKVPDIMDINDVMKGVYNLGKRGRGLQEYVHELAVQALLHAQQHNDYSIPAKIINAAPQGIVLKDLRAWFELHMPVKFRKVKETGLLQSKKNKKSDVTDILIEQAVETPYYEMTIERKESEKEEFTSAFVVKRLNNVVKNLRGKAEKADLAQSEKIKVESVLKQVQDKLDELTAAGIDF